MQFNVVPQDNVNLNCLLEVDRAGRLSLSIAHLMKEVCCATYSVGNLVFFSSIIVNTRCINAELVIKFSHCLLLYIKDKFVIFSFYRLTTAKRSLICHNVCLIFILYI